MIRATLYIGIILSLLFPSISWADPPSARPKLVVGGDYDCPPYEFLDNGAATGFDAELMRAVASVMGFDIEFRLGPWNDARRDLEQGKIDALVGMYYSADRGKQVDFSVTHTLVTSGIFVRKGSGIRSYADIQGKEIIVQEGDIIHDSLKRNGLASRIVAVKDPGQVLKLLSSGKHDCAIMPSRLQGEYFIKAFGLTNIKAIDAKLPQLRYCFAVRKGDQALLSKLDEGLKILKLNGVYRELYEKWFGVYEKNNVWDAVKYYVLALAAVVALCLVFLVWSRMLKKRVDQRTMELRRSEQELERARDELEKRVEERTAELAETVQQLLLSQFCIDKAAIGIYQTSFVGNILSANDFACRSLGYTSEELLALKVTDIDPFITHERILELKKALDETGSVTHETVHRRKDGSTFPVEITASNLKFQGTSYTFSFVKDITERKQADAELKLTQFLVDEASIGIHQISDDGSITYVNEFFCRSLGYSREELCSMTLFDIDPLFDYNKFTHLLELISNDGSTTLESVHRRKDGSIFPVEISVSYLEYQDKKICVAFAMDITKRKRAEEALREASLVVENSPVVLFRWKSDDGWPVELVSTNIIQFGYEPDEFLSGAITYTSIIHPDDVERVTREIRAFCNGGEAQFRLEYRILTKRGDIRWVNEHTNVERNDAGGVQNFEGIVIDVTERRQTEEDLRKANMVVENSPVVLFRCKAAPGWPVELVSKNVIQFGYAPEEFLSGELTYSSIVHPKDLEKVISEMDEFVVTGDGQLQQEYRIVTRAGDVRWIIDETVCERNKAGEITHYEGVIIDVTERRKAEEQLIFQQLQLKELNCTLEERVREEVAKNREKDIMLIQQNRQAALGEMLDQIAHQWKQPLNSIALIIQDVGESSEHGELTQKQVNETVGATMALLNHMTQTIDTFRAFYRPDKEKIAFNIKDSIDQALTFISPAFKYHFIETGLEADPGLTGFGYPKEYAQALLNILANARDIVRSRSTAEPRVMIKAFTEDSMTVVTIADNAGGIPEAILDKIFDFYFTTNESSGGTGIGLYMSRNIIEKNMGGTLSAVNRDDGALFRIAIPSAC